MLNPFDLFDWVEPMKNYSNVGVPFHGVTPECAVSCCCNVTLFFRELFQQISFVYNFSAFQKSAKISTSILFRYWGSNKNFRKC